MIANFDSMYSCKTLYNVLSHSHWGLGQLVGGRGGEEWSPLKFRGRGSEKKESLQRLASLLQ